MIRPMGYHYTVKLHVPIELDVTVHNADAAEDEAIEIVTKALHAAGLESDIGVYSTERGEQALDITEDD